MSSSRIKGPPTRTLRGIQAAITELPKTAAIEVPRELAPELGGEVRASYDSGTTVHGDARPVGVDGSALSLVAGGDTRRGIGFASDGSTRVRAVAPTRYTKFLIGKYGILPSGNAAIPSSWLTGMEAIARRRLDEGWERIKGGLG